MDIVLENSTSTVTVSITEMGNDIALSITGGEAPHIGCVVMAQPRPSLTGSGMSATHSVLNCIGHKDDFMAIPIADKLAAKLQCTIVVSCGIHIDNATSEQIESFLQLQESICDAVINALKKGSHNE